MTNSPKRQLAKNISIFLITVFGFLSLLIGTNSSQTSAATSSYLNFQARLLSSSGNIVPDGNYNVDFKIYNADSTTGTVGICSGACLWEETRTGGNQVRVVDGYLTVNLGSVTPFPAINWDQQLYLTMNIGGTGGSPSWDGEMQNSGHSIKLTALPYAFRAGALAKTDGSGNVGTLSFGSVTTNPTITLPDASGTVCLQNAAACGFAVGSGNAFLQGGNTFGALGVLGTNDANSLAFRTNNTNKLIVDTSGNLTFQQASTINNAAAASGTQLTVKGGDANSGTNAGGTLLLEGGAGNSTGAPGSVVVKANTNESTAVFQVQNTSSRNLLNINSTNSIVTVGNATDTTQLNLIGSAALQKGADFSTIGTSNDVNFGNVSLVRLTGASAQTITGIANGRDGFLLTIINAASNAATISNNSGSSLAANRIITGTGADFSLPAGSSVLLVYDSTSSLWRMNASPSSSGSGVTTVGAIDGNGASANGASISGSSIYMQSASGTNPGLVNTTTQTFAGNKTFSGDVNVTGSEALQKGTDFSTTGTTENASFSDASLIRLTGASLQTIGGIANGRDGYRLTLINAGSVTAVINNNDGASSAANRITTGTGGNINLPVGSSITLVYDATASLWRATADSTSLQNAYNNSNSSPQITVDSTRNAVVIQDASSPIGASLFTVQSNGGTSKYLDVSAATDSLQVAASGTINIGTDNVATKTINIGSVGSTAQNTTVHIADSSAGVQTVTIGSTNSTSTTTIRAGSGNINLTGNVAVSANLDATGSEALKKGTDFSTTGTTNDANFSNASLIRLTGASAQTITGVANGRDGYLLTIINAAGQAATISNNNGSSSAANRIITGTGADYSLAAGSSIQLIYDSGSSLWRMNAGSAGVTTIGTYSNCTAYANGASITGNTLTLGCADATHPGLIDTGTQTFAGAKTFNGNLSAGANLDVTGSLAAKKGTDFSSTGTQNNINFSNASLIRLTNASALTITGIANGRDGYILDLVNASGQSVVIKNNDTGDSSAGNVILTGTGSDYSMPLDSAVQLIYDATTSKWRMNASISTLQADYNNSTSPQITVASGTGGVVIQDASSPIGASLFTVQSNGGTSKYLDVSAATDSLQVAASGTINIGTDNVATKTINIGSVGSTAQNTTVHIADSSAGVQTVTIGSASSTSAVTLQGGTGNSIQLQSQGTILIGNNAVAQTITIGNATGATAINLQCGTGTCGLGNNATDHSTTIGSTTGASLTTIQAGTSGVLVKPTTSLVAFQVQNASSALLTGDTTNMRVGVDVTYTAMSTPTGLTLGAATSSGANNLTLNHAYYYKVTAIDSNGGETAATAEQCRRLASSGSNKTIPVSWNPVSGANSYKIYRSDGGAAACSTSNAETYLITLVTTSYNDDNSAPAGTATAPNSTTAYVPTNNSNSTLQLTVGGEGTPTGQVYVSGIAPKLVGNVVNSANVYSYDSSSQSDTYIQGRYDYIATPSRLNAVDISNPALPFLVASDTNGGSFNVTDMCGVVVQGHYAYVAAAGATSPSPITGSFLVYDLSNSNFWNGSNPAPIGGTSVGLTTNNNCNLQVQGRYAYLDTGNGNIGIYDVSKPAAPTMVGKFGANDGQFVIQGSYLYQTDNNFNLTVWNISNPTSPTQVATTTIPPPNDIWVQGNYVYIVTSSSPSLYIFDVTNPTNPFQVNTVTTNLSNPTHVVVQGRYAYVVDATNNKLNVYDISNPIMPVYITQNSDSKLNGSNSFAVSGRYAYVISDNAFNGSSGGLNIYDLGGTYTQQLEAGGIETGVLQVEGAGQVAGDFNIQGGLSIGNDLQATGNVGITGGVTSQGSNILTGGNNQLSVPTISSVTPTGGSGTTWGYKVTAINSSGGETTASTESTTATGAATLNGTHYNTIAWGSISGASSYKVYRTTAGGTPNTTGLIGVTSTTSFVDNGNAGGTAAPTINTTGQLTVQGAALFENTSNSTTAFQIQQASAGTVLFAADTTNLVITISGNTTTFANLTLTNAHFKSAQTTAPTIGTPTNCGTSPSAAVTTSSTDSAGSFTITAGTGGGYTTCDTVFTFNKAYGTAPKAIILQPTTAVGSATGLKSAQVSVTSTTTFTVKLTTNPAVDSEINGFYYWVVE